MDGKNPPNSIKLIFFTLQGTTLSGVEFELIGAGYRVSLVKRRFVSGSYIIDYYHIIVVIINIISIIRVITIIILGSYVAYSAGKLLIAQV